MIDVDSRNVSQVTNDAFSDFEPCWSPDSQNLVFVSDRGALSDSMPQIWQHDFGSNDLYRIRPDGSGLERITPWASNEHSPEFYHGPDSLLYVSDRNGISNIYLRVLSTGDEFPLTDLMVGVQHLSISRGGQRLAFTSFYRGGYDVYLWRSPLASLGKHQALELTNFMQNRAPSPSDSSAAPQ